MPDIWYDVDAALAEVPVNVLALTDDTDFKTREVAITYDQAGMDLVWNFVTTAGAFTQTAVTPTTSGIHDWAHQGDGMYTLEIPASGGTIDNDTEGFGWFTGFATGVLPWRGPVVGFRAAGLNNVLIDLAYSATRGLTGTALPAAAADAAGGLPISDAGELDLDTKLANTHEVTAARLSELDAGTVGKMANQVDEIRTDTGEIGTAGAGLSDLGGMSDGMKAEVESEVDDSIAGLNDPTAAAIADAVMDEPRADHVAAGSFGRFAHLIRDGTAQAGEARSITLDSGASAVDDLYIDAIICIIGGTGAGQSRRIKNYVGSTKVVSVQRAWATNPNDTSIFIIIPQGRVAAESVPFTMVSTTIATLASQTSFTLANGSSDDDAYNDMCIIIHDTTTVFRYCTGHVLNYVGSSKTITLIADPGVFVMAVGDTVDILSQATHRLLIADTVFDEPISGHTAGGSFGEEIQSHATPTEVNSQVVDALSTDTYAEPGQGAPAATASLVAKVGYLYKFLRNKLTQTATTLSVYNDAGDTVDQKATVSDDDTTFTRGEIETGP